MKKQKVILSKQKSNGVKRSVRRRAFPHPNFKAWKKFIETDDYKRLTNGSTIRLPKDCEIYLANRIKSTWDTAWAAAEKAFA